MYEKLDFLITAAIEEHSERTASNLLFGESGQEIERIASATRRESLRVLDGRLQAMRKRGLIRYVGGAWRKA